MYKIKFRKLNDIYNYEIVQNKFDKVIYTDTDSMFVSLPFISNELIDIIEKFTMKVGKDLALKHGADEYETNYQNLLLKIRFKNDYTFKNVIFYAKKSYLGIKIIKDKDSNIIFEPVMTGVEGKRNTAKFIENIVKELIEYLKTIKYGEEDFSDKRMYKIYRKYRDRILKIKSISEGLEILGLPLNISQSISNLKSIQSQYRGCIVFNCISEKILGIRYWEEFTSGKGLYLHVKPKNLAIVSKIINEFKKYKPIILDLEKKDAATYIKDLTIPIEFINNKEILKEIEKYFELDYASYLDKIKSKFKNLYFPLNKKFFLKLNKNTRQQKFYHINNEYFLIVKEKIKLSEKELEKLKEE